MQEQESESSSWEVEKKRREESIFGFLIMLIIIAIIGFSIVIGMKTLGDSQQKTFAKEKERQTEQREKIAAIEESLKAKDKLAVENGTKELPAAYKDELETSYGTIEIALMNVEQTRVQNPHMITEESSVGYTLRSERKSAVIKSLTPFDKLPSIKDIAPELDSEMQPVLKERKIAEQEAQKAADEERRKVEESYQKYLNENSK